MAAMRNSEAPQAVSRSLDTQVSRIAPVPLRDLWHHEVLDFTAWLADNLDFVAEGKIDAVDAVQALVRRRFVLDGYFGWSQRSYFVVI